MGDLEIVERFKRPLIYALGLRDHMLNIKARTECTRGEPKPTRKFLFSLSPRSNGPKFGGSPPCLIFGSTGLAVGLFPDDLEPFPKGSEDETGY
ncbi:hypothetical protein RUM44_001013 [Polyplax serrata]|uniref:Uncharacterized protein n=1 Tax=Polyplax serrata TaxID=468196 RepID=A0ABR1B6M5_POLSC